MTGAVCDNYPCTWSTHDTSKLEVKLNGDSDAAEEAQYRWENGGEQDALEAMWDRQEQEDAIAEGTAETNFGATSSLNERRVPTCMCNRCLGFGDETVCTADVA
tara:strand:- start:40 stop:351 length:312 start_codon:yes stop_codon:yes gene_type:complete